jgi:HK97 gp10 family phage protein
VEANWRNVNEVVDDIRVPLDQVTRKGAEMIARDARARVPIGNTGWVSAGRSGGSIANSHLRDQIDVTASKFKDGGWIVAAQGTGNYDKFYASFVEFGTHKMKAQKYMRPAIKRNRPKIQKMWQESLDR